MELDVEQVILTLVIIFALAKAASYVFARFGMPGLIGEIIIGIVIVNLTIGDFNLESWLGLSPVTEGGVESESPTHMILEMFSELGVVFLLFTVGLETKVKDLTSVGRTAFLVALLGVLVPFFVGYAYVTMVDSNIYHAMFMGAAMVATSVGITARVIKDLNLMDARESRIIIGAAVIDDILGMIVLAIVSGMAETGSLNLGSIVSIALVSVVFVVAIILVAAKLVPAFYKSVEERNEAKLRENPDYIRPRPNMFILSVIACLAFAYLAEVIGLAAIIGAFLAGMLFAEHAWEWKLEERFEAVTTLFVSFFFVYVGMNVDLQAFVDKPALIGTAVLVIIMACLTKFIGCGLGAKVSEPRMPGSSLSIIGVGMMPRGEVGIIIALIGLGITVNGGSAVSTDMYNIIVLMCIATTLIAPPILSKLFRKKYHTEYVVTPEDRL